MRPIEDKKKVELLAPAGNFEKLEIAIHYGADAVYLAGKTFSLRSFSENFTFGKLHEAVKFAQRKGVKTYVTCNIYPRNHEQKALAEYLNILGDIGPDAVIVTDPGALMMASKIIPHISLHLSTQANTTNYQSALFWQRLGIMRINAARELSLTEINEIAQRCDLEVEAFVHGAMCISYSGRCLLSNFMANRDSNHGECAHPCRWKYAVVEEQRPGHYLPIEEDHQGSYIFNSKDLCMIEYIPEMVESGVASLKIEGRMKGIHYLASTVKTYREAIDAFLKDPENYRVKAYWLQELAKVNYRGYCTGFYFGDPQQISPAYDKKKHANPTFLGKVKHNDHNPGVNIHVRNKIFKGDAIEVLQKKGPSIQDTVNAIFDQNGQPLSFAQPNSIVTIELNNDYGPNDLIRRRTL
jgi:putative protease